MEFSGFCLGLRFILRAEGKESTENNAWNLIFSTLSPKEAEGIELHGLWKAADCAALQDCYLCALSGMSLSISRQIWKKLASNPAIRAELMFFEPVYQLNQMMLLDGYSYIGRADTSGKVFGGECTYGSMQFSGKDDKKSMLKKRHAANIFLAFSSLPDLLDAEECLRVFMHALAERNVSVACIPFPVDKKPTEVIKYMLASCGGRYDLCKQMDSARLLACGVLPDQTVAISADDLDSALTCANHAYRQGFRKFIVATNSPADSIARNAISTAKEASLQDAQISLLEQPLTTEQYLDLLCCKRHLAKADMVIVLGDREEAHKLSKEVKKAQNGLSHRHVLLSIATDELSTKAEAIDAIRSAAESLSL